MLSKYEYAQEMKEIEKYCIENGIEKTKNNSCYFTHKGINYRLSNHTTLSNNHIQEFKNFEWKYYTVGILRIIEVHKNILAGHQLDKRGRIKK